MFNLVGKRYLFLLISLIVIIPGTISLLVKGLNVGIDFAGGATVELRPSTQIAPAAVSNALKPLNLANLTVLTGNYTNLPANGVIWVRLNTQIDGTVQQYILTTLQHKYGNQLVVQFSDLSLGQKVTLVTIAKFPQGTSATPANIKSLLNNIPKTTDVNKPTSGTSSTPTPSATVGKGTPTATATPHATATPKATGTPAANPTATATPTTSTPAATIPVKYVDVQTGTTTGTIRLLTSNVVNPDKLDTIRAALINNAQVYTYSISNASVSPSVASETTLRAVLAVLAASVCILLYIWFSFRKVARPWRYGTCAIIALLHDVLVVLGIFSILGWLLDIQVDTLFITALLTVVGFSVHDTIVVFDRIRENMQRRTSETFDQVVNASLIQTMSRSLNTSLTVIFTLSALTLFGGVTVRTFTLTLLIGIISGTYSSIFNASMLLVIWEKGKLGLNRLRRDRTPDGREARELARSRG
ncbi:MAG: protein translocase subunit SecF [Ktedonobacteraceae bacterium]